MEQIEKLRQVFSQRNELGNPPELHAHFATLRNFKDLPLQKVEETVTQLLEDIEDVELTLKRYELQMKNKEKDDIYYKELIGKTEV